MSAARWQEANQRHLLAALQRVRAELVGGDEQRAASERALAAARDAMPDRPALESVAVFFGLSPFERDVLLLAAGPELDGSFGRAVADALGEATPRRATLGLALARLPGAYWASLAPAAPLRRWELIVLEPGAVLTARALAVDERILHYLAGVSCIDASLAPRVSALAPPPALPASRYGAVLQLAESWSGEGPRPVSVLTGRDVRSLEAVAAAAAAHVGGRAFRLRAADVPREAEERARFVLRWGREAALDRAILVVDASEPSKEESQAVTALAEELPSPLVVACRDGMRLGAREACRIEVGSATAVEQRAAWRASLGEAAAPAIERLVATFDLSPSEIGTLAVGGPEQAFRRAREHTRPRLEALAQQLKAQVTWDDLVLPEAQHAILRELAAQVRNRALVHDTWGFGARSGRGLGIAALFSGPSGTGKTLAAEVLAAELDLDLFRIDLAAVVSKYIGETEKNLARIFDAADVSGAILLFDEADALFGKRTEVKDSHDRYANIEVSYLLQRMEAYRGLAILTSNLRHAMDQAFLRRLRCVVDFPFPDLAQRARIWARAFPGPTPTSGLDIDALARLNLAGGNIKNIAIGAAFLAAEERCSVGMAHIERAARAEYVKCGRNVSELRLRASS